MKRKGFYFIGMVLIVIGLLAGCGSNNQSNASSDNSTSKQTTTEKKDVTKVDQDSSKDKAESTDAKTNTPDVRYIVVEPGTKKGSDGNLHDAFINGDIKVTAGQPVTLKFYNYDEMEHSYTSKELGINVKIAKSEDDGVPSVTTFTFTPDKAGTYTWQCIVPCDLDNNQWAMTQDKFMKGTITVLPKDNKTQDISLVVNPDGKAGSDGDTHDAFTPGNITIKAGEPVNLTIYNFDEMGHSFTSKDLGVNVSIAKSEDDGVPSVTTYTFTPDKTGSFSWQCIVPCDLESNQWAMTQAGFMKGTITVQ